MRRNMFKFVLFAFVFVGGLGIFQMDIKACDETSVNDICVLENDSLSNECEIQVFGVNNDRK